MIKKLKIISLFVVTMALMGAQMAYAAAGDLTWSSSQIIDFSSPDMNAVIASGSTAEGMVLNAGTLVMTLALGDVFTIATQSAGNFAVSPTTGVVINCSSSTIATVTITAAGSQAYTLTPSATACDYSAPSGGGGASTPPPATTPPPTPPVTPAEPATPAQKEVPGCGNRTTGFSTVNGASCALNKPTTPATPATPASPAAGSQGKSYAFGTALVKQGSRGAACKAWQTFLNDYASAGLKADGMCGKLTMIAAKAWQKSMGLSPDGLLGKASRAKALGM